LCPARRAEQKEEGNEQFAHDHSHCGKTPVGQDGILRATRRVPRQSAQTSPRPKTCTIVYGS
jgi:hypothetical protein